MMDDPYEYQNGGQWDWFGGRLVEAMFEHGFSRMARQKLIEIARKNAANKGLYEWDTPDGRGRGSSFYSGSAGSLAGALIEGYFGIKLESGKLSLEPKLGEDRATVHVYLPASGSFAAYDYRWDAQKKTVVFRFNSSISRAGAVKILVPSPGGKETSTGALRKTSVKKDGAKIPHRIEARNEDAYVVIETDFGNHTIEIRF